MASIQKTAKGYRVQINVKGQRDSATFPTKREAVDWAARRESEMRDNRPLGVKHTLLDAMRKYSEEVSATKRGGRWEQVRLSAFENYLLPLTKPMAQVTAADIALFRDSRLRSVASSSVIREITVLSSVFEAARREWGWVESNPCRDIRKPPSVKHRERTIAWWETKRLLRQMGYAKNKRVASTGHAVGVCLLVALRTGMRAGELCGLTWGDVHKDYCHLPMTKNGRSRDVPLSTKAKRLIDQMEGWDDDLVFGLKTASLDALFRKYRERAGLSGFTWHDSRHTAATILAKRLDVLTLCKVMGWTDTRFALVYFNPKASSIASMLG